MHTTILRNDLLRILTTRLCLVCTCWVLVLDDMCDVTTETNNDRLSSSPVPEEFKTGPPKKRKRPVKQAAAAPSSPITEPGNDSGHESEDAQPKRLVKRRNHSIKEDENDEDHATLPPPSSDGEGAPEEPDEGESELSEDEDAKVSNKR